MKKVVFALLGYFSLTFVNAQEKIGLGNITPDSMLTVSGGIRTTTGIVTGSDATINGSRLGRGGGNISSNLTLGINSLVSNTTGHSNLAVGFECMQRATTGTNNIAIGTRAIGNGITTGSDNFALGNYALYSNSSGYSNTSIGTETMLYATTGFSNVALGLRALGAGLLTGNSNLGIGNYALYKTTSGYSNIGVGIEALYESTTGSGNLAFGFQALYGITSGYNNIAIGNQAGRFINSGSANQISFNSIYIGTDARPSIDGNNNETVIGSQARGQGSNTITLGNNSVTSLYCYDTSISSPSDKRDKKDIEPLEIGLEFLKKIEPVAFTWNMRDGGKKDVRDLGFIAQQVKPAQDMERQGQNLSLVHYQSGEDRYFMQYSNLIPVLVKAVKEQQVQIDKLNSQIIALNKQLAVMAVENSTSNVVEKKSKR
jgi:hypothetical protein